MGSRLATLIVGLVVTLAQPARAQQSLPLPATLPLHFETWQAAPRGGTIPSANTMAVVEGDRKDRWLINGAIGAFAGLVVCTAISTVIDDSARGLSFCPLDTYAIMAGAGFVVGVATGAAF